MKDGGTSRLGVNGSTLMFTHHSPIEVNVWHVVMSQKYTRRIEEARV